MLACLQSLVAIGSEQELEALNADPTGAYVLSSDLRCVQPPHQFSEFTGMLYGRYNLLQLAQPDALFANFSGLLLRIRVEMNVSTSADQYALFDGFLGGVRQAQIQVRIVASRSRNGTIAVIKNPLALDVRNSTVIIETITDRTLNVLGVADGGSRLQAVDLEVILRLGVLPRPYTYPYAIAVGAEVSVARNLSVSVHGDKVLLLYGISEAALEEADDVCVRVEVTNAYGIYALCASAPLRRLQGIRVYIEASYGEAMTLTEQLTAGIALVDNCSVRVHSASVGSSYAPNICGLFLKSGLVNLSRIALAVYARADSSIDFYGIGEAQAFGTSYIRQLMVSADVHAANFNGMGYLSGVFGKNACGEFYDIAVDIKCYSKVSMTAVVGFYLNYTKPYTLSAYQARILATVNGTSTFFVSGVYWRAAMSSSVTGYTVVRDAFVYLSCSSIGWLYNMAVAGISVECQALKVFRAAVEFQLRATLSSLTSGGIAITATGLTIDMVHVQGNAEMASYLADTHVGRASGLIVEARGVVSVSDVIVDVNLTTDCTAACSSAIVTQFEANISISCFISVGSIFYCNSSGTTLPSAQHIESVYELTGPSKDISPSPGVIFVNETELKSIRFESDRWVTLLGARHYYIKALPRMQENGFCACDKAPDFGELFATEEPGLCLFAAARLHNMIHPAIGVLDNPFGICRTPVCASNCSGQGVLENYSCVCNAGRAGVLCEIERCTFPEAISAVSGGFQHCWCADGFQYVLDVHADNGEKCWQTCVEPICYLGGVCYENASLYACEFCGPYMTGDRCDRCKDQSTALTDDLECRPSCLSCPGNCWFAEDDCLGPNSCAFVCNRCDDYYVLVNKRCFPQCIDCGFGACWFEGDCAEAANRECLLRCSACISEHHEMPRCDSCVPGYFFDDPGCFEVLFGFGGLYYVKNGAAVMIACDAGLDMLEGRCKLRCEEGACGNGHDCHYDGWAAGAEFFCASCKVPFIGRRCDRCLDGFVLFEEKCYAAHYGVNGECFNYDGGFMCVSCHTGYTGSACAQCDEGYKAVGPQCLKACGSCLGDCYHLDSGAVQCDSCWRFYALPDCAQCEEHKEMHGGVCSKQLNLPHGQNCFESYRETKCERCDAGFEGALCDYCASGHFFDGATCSVIVDDNWCSASICLRCNATNVLIAGACLPRCTLPRCRGNCGMNGATVKCDSCASGFVLAAGECFPEVANDNGVCFLNGSYIICQCRGEAIGAACEACTGLIVNGTCFARMADAKGDCFASPLDPSSVICTSCWPQYEPPLCEKCSFGHAEDASGECTVCRPGFAFEGGVCTIECDSCTHGQCAHAGAALSCARCFEGYANADCTDCEEHFVRYGAYCLLKGYDGGVEVALGEPVRYRCAQAMASFNCSRCAPGCDFGGQCRQRSPLLPELCYEEDATAVCALPAYCALYDTSQRLCLSCFPGDLLLTGDCYAPAYQRSGRVAENRLYAAPQCYQSRRTGYTFCTACEAGRAPPTCSTCLNGFVLCSCAAGLCCCPKAPASGGLCYTYNGAVSCQFCFDKYAFSAGRGCVRQSALATPQIALIAVAAVLCCCVLAGVITITIALAKSPLLRRRVQLKLARFWAVYGPQATYLALTQLIAAASAVQSLFLKDFEVHTTVQLAASAPFCAAFVFGYLPRFSRYYIQNTRDFALLLTPAAAHTANAALYFYLLAPAFVLHWTFYDLLGALALLALFYCINRAPAGQKSALLLVALLAFELVVLAACAVGDAAGAYFDNAQKHLVLLSLLAVLARLALYCGASVAVDLILQRYGCFKALVYTATVQFVVSGVIFLCAPQGHYGVFSEAWPFVFCAATQIAATTAGFIIMDCVGVVNHYVGLGSTALWLQIIERAGEIALATQNGVRIGHGRLVLAVAYFAVWIAGLVLFYVFQYQPVARAGKAYLGPPNGVQPLAQYLKRQRAVFVADADYRLIKHPTQCLDLRIVVEACEIVDDDMIIDQAERILFRR